MTPIDRRFLCFQLVRVTLWSLWVWRWLVTWDPATRRLGVWEP